MRIKNNALGFTQAPGQQAQPAGLQNSNHGISSKAGDSVRLSSATQLASSDSPKVRQLAGDYAAGRYRLSPQEIAASIIDALLQA